MLRYLFLAWSVFFGIVVLLGHLHYTIDVLSAFFITYGIVDIAKWLFPTPLRVVCRRAVRTFVGKLFKLSDILLPCEKHRICAR